MLILASKHVAHLLIEKPKVGKKWQTGLNYTVLATNKGDDRVNLNTKGYTHNRNVIDRFNLPFMD